jgi:hypothetical protein
MCAASVHRRRPPPITQPGFSPGFLRLRRERTLRQGGSKLTFFQTIEFETVLHDRLWIYMGYRIRAQVMQQPDGAFHIQRLEVQRTSRSTPAEVAVPRAINQPRATLDEALGVAYTHACKIANSGLADDDHGH